MFVTAGKPLQRKAGPVRSGALIINADDWGRDPHTTDRTLECIVRGAVSSVSAMVFMADSQRAASIALDRGIDVGLHLNLTASFSASGTSMRLIDHQTRLSDYLERHRLAQVLFHPGLTSSFNYVVASQLDEFSRLYGTEPERIDGHHHMHLCSNVLFGGLLPDGKIVRRSASFRAGEKSVWNRAYRLFVDSFLARRHRVTDFFFSLVPITPADRLEKIVSLASEFTVEVGTHPLNPEEYRFLTGGGILRLVGNERISPHFTAHERFKCVRI